METFVNENAFISMVTATVEAYPQETLGVLVGVRGINTFMVQYAIAYQTARRSRREVEPHLKRSKRTDQFLQNVTRLEVIGDFHSHTMARLDRVSSIQLSEADKTSMSIGNLGIVIAINRESKQREWRHLRKGSLKGSVFPYSLKITSWFKPRERKYEITKIHCPFALGLGR